VSTLALFGGQPIRNKPFHGWPVADENEISALEQVVRSGKWGAIQGARVREFEKAYAEYHHAKHGMAVFNGTVALEIALQACGIGPGDEVILPAYTFIASASAVLSKGAVPVFADIDLDTFTIDLRHAESVLTPRARAIMPVQFAGRPCDMDAAQAFAEKHRLKIIEDAAQAWGASWRGTPVGAIGHAGSFSFQSSKNITAGEGGVLLTNHDDVAEMIRSLRNCGRLESGLWYAHYHIGTNARMTEFQAAILLAQLQRYPAAQEHRHRKAQTLDRMLATHPGLRPLRDDANITRHAHHLYILRYLPEAWDGLPKGKFLEAMKAEGVPLSAGYSLPLYEQPVFKNRSFGTLSRWFEGKMDYNDVHLPNTHAACYEQAIWIVQSYLLGSEEDMRDIARAAEKVYEHREELLAQR
jgi:dTDP-4-amino-4,6-dideoxygalactose transaminase